MKKLFLVVIALLMVNSLSAQEWQKNIFGVRAGLNVSSFSTSYDEDLDVRTAFHVGFNYERLLAKNLPLYLETGLQLSAKGTQYNDFGEAQYTCDAYYLEVPLMLNYKINIKDVVTLYPSAGFYGAYGVGGKFKYEEVGSEWEVDTFSEEGGVQNWDFGYRLSASAAYKRITLTIGYEGGISDIVDDASEEFVVGKMKNQNFFISLGYNF